MYCCIGIFLSTFIKKETSERREREREFDLGKTKIPGNNTVLCEFLNKQANQLALSIDNIEATLVD